MVLTISMVLTNREFYRCVMCTSEARSCSIRSLIRNSCRTLDCWTE